MRRLTLIVLPVFFVLGISAMSDHPGARPLSWQPVGKKGLIGKGGTFLVNPGTYDYLSRPESGFIIFRKNGLLGYLNTKGEEAIPAQFTEARNFSNGYACVQKKIQGVDRFTIINTAGEPVTDFKFRWCTNFSQGLAGVGEPEAEKGGYIDSTGRLQIPFTYGGGAAPFRDGLALVATEHLEQIPVNPRDPIIIRKRKYYFINKQNKIIVDFEKRGYSHTVKSFSEGRVVVSCKDGGEAFIDTTGKQITPCKYGDDTGMSEFHEGTAVVTIGNDPKDRLAGYINLAGKEIVPPRFACAKHFSEGLGRVSELKVIGRRYYCGQTGFVDKEGKLVIPMEFDDFEIGHYFKEGLCPVAKDGRWGFMDKRGNIVIDFQFAEVGSFHEGLAPARAPKKFLIFGGKWGYVNTEGDWVIEPQFDYAEAFSEGIAEVWVK